MQGQQDECSSYGNRPQQGRGLLAKGEFWGDGRRGRAVQGSTGEIDRKDKKGETKERRRGGEMESINIQ